MDSKALIESLVDIVIKEGGSDLHISAGRMPSIRVATQLVPLANQAPLTQDQMMEILGSILDKSRLDLFLKEQEIDFSYDHRNGAARLRGNAFFHKGAIGVALRLIPKVRTMEELKLPQALVDFTRKKQGFFLVVGPVGQGKSTTLSAMVDAINTERAEHILTIEDPIEYIFEEKHSIIDQREIGIDTKDFPTGLRSIFREDVNVIMIGEMRSPETIATAVTAAETGHLVLSTLHTNNAAQTIDRIIDSFPGDQQDQIRAQLAESLLGIFSQRLIPRITGGLVPAYELLINNNAVGNLIREKRTHEIDVVIETGTEQGMMDMNRSLLDLVRAGEITMESAYLYSMNPKGLGQIL
ncbi:MAG: PilT/PilU family type 4a pilus ATPase [Candidatus Pacebacteria bacterium]|nr:PilT/PilU family type 4a pilus ATPase [Candidatus Paceibacterota bacterium]